MPAAHNAVLELGRPEQLSQLEIVENDAVDMDETLKIFPMSLSSVKDYDSRTLGRQVDENHAVTYAGTQ